MPDLRGLLSRIGGAASSMRDNLMPADGLLSSGDTADARRTGLLSMGAGILNSPGGNIFKNLAAGVQAGQAGYTGAVDSALKSQDYAQNRQDQTMARGDMAATRAHTQGIMAARTRIAQKYAPQPGETTDQAMQRLPAMYQEYLQAGDLESAKAVEGIVAKQAEGAPTELQNVGNASNLIDKRTGKIISTTPIHPTAEAVTNMQAMRSQAASNARMAADNHTAMLESQNQGRALSQGRMFNSDPTVKTILGAQASYSAFSAAMEQALNKNSAATKSVVINFAGNVDSKAQLRLGVLQYLSKLDPSIQGQIHLTADGLTTGTIPTYILRGMLKHVNDLHDRYRGDYQRKYDAAIAQNPYLSGVIQTPETAVGKTETFGGGASGGPDLTPFMGGWKH